MYVQIDTLLLDDVFENLRNMFLTICKLDPAKFFQLLILAWQAALKKDKVKLDFLTDIDMLLMVKKVLEKEYVTLFINMEKLITNT